MQNKGLIANNKYNQNISNRSVCHQFGRTFPVAIQPAICRNPALLIFCLGFLILTGCAPIPIPINAPEPFSGRLSSFLDQEWVDRAAVTRWLGEPAASRLDGDLVVYVEPRELSRDFPPPGRHFELHYLLVEYDAAGLVLHHDLIVNSGCTARNRCVSRRSCQQAGCTSAGVVTDPLHVPELDELKIMTANQLVVYADPAMDRDIKSTKPAADVCRLIIYRDAEFPMVKIGNGESHSDFVLPNDGYLTWISPPAIMSMRISWSDWRGRYETEKTEIDCQSGETHFLQIQLRKTATWGWRYSMTPQEVSIEIGNEAINERFLVLH